MKEEINDTKNLDELSDEILLERFKNGERESFDILVERYQRKAVNYIYRLSRNFDLAEDVVQTGFLTVYQKASLFHKGCKFSPWFYKILTNLYRYEMRRKRHILQISLEDSYDISSGRARTLGETIPDRVISPLDELEKKEEKDRIEKLVASLPEKQKIVLTLYIYNEMNYKDIARALGCSLGTVKSRIHYALRNLKGKISEFKDGDNLNEVQTDK